MLSTPLRLSTSPYQLLNTKNPSSSSFKFVSASKCGDQLAFYNHLKTKKWRKLEQHSIENHSHMAQSVVQLTCIQVAGSNPGGEQIFFWISILLQTRFFRIQFWQHCYFTFQACIEAKLERNWTHVIFFLLVDTMHTFQFQPVPAQPSWLRQVNKSFQRKNTILLHILSSNVIKKN